MGMPVAYVMHLIDGRQTLAQLATEAGLSPPALPKHFNPFQESIHHVGLAPVAPKKLSEEGIKQRELRKQERLEAEAGPPVDMQPSCFWLSAGRKLQDVIRETSGDSKGADVVGDKALPRNYKHCVLRVICPDKSVLQVNFRAFDRGQHVLQQIGSLLSPSVQSAAWYIYITPPLKRLAANETLAAAGLAPGAIMYLGFDGQRPEAPFLGDG